MESNPVEVSLTKQAGAVRDRWTWTKPWIWTDRMLTALENGVKGGKWFSLMAELLLCKAWAVQPEHRLRDGSSILNEVKPSTGEPYSGEPDVRFGGRGDRELNRSSLPLLKRGSRF